MTPLVETIRAQIAAEGPMSLADYMALCLGHREHGYYVKRDPLGAEGDFTTAPEISQMFGELIGLALAQAWIDRGSPSPFILAELGPGRGTLMADALRATSGITGFAEAAQLWLVETSPALKHRQWEALAPQEPSWADSLEAVPEGPLFLVANEFFDALPIRQFMVGDGVLRERVVGIEEGALRLGLSPPLGPVEGIGTDASEGAVIETCPAGRAIAEAIGARLAADGGMALIVDYGHARSASGDTFQAVRAHRSADPLDAPGEADLTAHVDFQALAEAAERGGAIAWPVREQGAWLEWLGIRVRASMLAKRSPERAGEIEAALHRLTAPEAMGRLFKVLALSGDETPPPGFDAETGA